ncbi:uncharacterized protein RHOBADRAFT_44634 [Rhodotorula graminis WP1]|uniref:Capsular associated protein n=1 Tax=Rhodotorula graminis (strain WP1) TaxID=578459 RepID=A0A194S0T7_RHOGW|nr:uncharacterized protein RHOBADRAFT_44634 [Rhodotorula graminis WP1]KPV74149.1 hypothetical protein RHOBADRAFT_44634 [Rhodotorula graminis WP1]
MGGAIELLSPPSSPVPGRPSFAPRTRYRPSLTTVGWILLYAATFLVYQHQLRAGGPSGPTSTSLSLSDAAGSSLATTSCEVCHLDPSNPLCEYGLDNIRTSRAYEGSGARLRRVLQRALAGEEIEVGVIGASVTQGHGLAPGKQRWEDRWFDDFRALFPKAKMHVGAVAATDSRFFSYCFEAVVPRDLDLYLVELDVNNAPGPQTLRDDDALMRGLLQLPQEPAVVRISAFTTIFNELARGAISSLITSQFFDVPVIGIRNFLLPQVIRHRETAEELFGLDQGGHRDYRHIGHVSHAAMADMLSLFIRKEVCEAQRRAVMPPSPAFEKSGPWPGEADQGKVPELALWSSWINPEPLVPVTPMCQSTMCPLSPLQVLSHSPTFEFVTWNDKHAWASSTPGAQIRIKFRGTKVGVFVYASNGRGADEASADPAVRKVHAPGQALCWVEEPDMTEDEWRERYGGDNVEEEKDGPAAAQTWFVTTHWPNKPAPQPEFVEMAEGLDVGEHVLACEVSKETTSGGHLWRIMGIASQ